MKNKLLITTALVTAISATNVYAQAALPDLTVTESEELTGDQGVVYNTISVEQNGTLTLENANIKTSTKDSPTTDITINGKLALTNSVLEAGSDLDDAANNSNMLLEGATVDMTDSDLEANGNITIKNTTLTSKTTASESFGLWADGNITIEGGETNLSNSYIAAAGDILFNGGEYTFSHSDISSNNGSITIKSGNFNGTGFLAPNGDLNVEGGNIKDIDSTKEQSEENEIKNLNIKGGVIDFEGVLADNAENVNISGGTVNLLDSEIAVWEGNLNISGGEVNLLGNKSQESALYARKELNITGGTINMSGDNTVIDNVADYKPDSYPAYDLNITGGTINVTGKEAEISSSKNININGGTINIAEGSRLDMFGENENVPTTVQIGKQGIFNISGTLNTSINGNGTINFNSDNANITGNVNMTEGGVMNIGLNNAVVEGDATFNSGSTLKLEIADSGNGSLTANSIMGNQGSKLALNITKQMELGQTESFDLLKTESLTNNFTNEISNNRYDVEFKDGKFNVTYVATAADVVSDNGGTINNANTAEAWSNMSSSSIDNETAQSVAAKLNDLSQNDSKAYVDALTAVAPEVAPMVQKTQSETANQVFGAVSTRLTGGSVSTGGEGMSSGDSVFERAAMWVQGLFNHSKLDDTSKSYGFDADSSGIAMGAEKYVTEDTKIGLGYAYTNTDIDGFMRSTDVDTHTAFVYGEYKPSNWYVNGIMSYGWSDYSESKNVSGIGVKADYDAETFGLQAMTGYDMQVKGFGLTPEVGLRYVHISQDAYTDTADQSVSGNDSDILTGVIGAKVTKAWQLSNGMMIKPEAKFALTYDLFNDDASSVVSLANGSAYTVEGEALDRFGMEFGAGVTAEVNDNIEFSLGYEGKFREDYQDHTGLINAKYKF